MAQDCRQGAASSNVQSIFSFFSPRKQAERRCVSCCHMYIYIYETLTHFNHKFELFLYIVFIILLLLFYFTMFLESKKKVEKEVGRLREAREAPPQS